MPPREPEKRRARRAKHNSVLELFDAEGNLITGIGRLVDFSSTGVCFASNKTFWVGDRVTARLRLLREGVLEIDASIIWARKKPNTTHYGIRFDSVKPSSR